MPKNQELEKFKQKLQSGQLEDLKEIFDLFRHIQSESKKADFPRSVRVKDVNYNGIKLGLTLEFNSKKHGRVSMFFNSENNLEQLMLAALQEENIPQNQYLQYKSVKDAYEELIKTRLVKEAQDKENAIALSPTNSTIKIIENIFRWGKFDEAGNEKERKMFKTIEAAYSDEETREIIFEIVEQVLDYQLALEPQETAQVAAAAGAAAASYKHEEDAEKTDFEGIMKDVEKYQKTIADCIRNVQGKNKTVEITSDFLKKMRRLMNHAFDTRNFKPEEKNYVIDDTYFSLYKSGKLLIADPYGNEVILSIDNSKNIFISPVKATIMMNFAENLVDFLNFDTDVDLDDNRESEIESGSDSEQGLDEIVEMEGGESISSFPKLNLTLTAIFSQNDTRIISGGGSGSSGGGKRTKSSASAGAASSHSGRQPSATRTENKMTYKYLETILGKKSSLDIGYGFVINLQSLGEIKAWSITQNGQPAFEDLHDPKAIVPDNIANAANSYLANQRQAGSIPRSPQGSQFDQSLAGQKRGPTQ